MKKGYIPPLIAILITVLAFLWTSYNLVPSGNLLVISSFGVRIIAVTFCAFVASLLWSSVLVVVIILPMSALLFKKIGPNATTSEENLGVLILYAVSFLLIWLQFFLFGSGLPFVIW